MRSLLSVTPLSKNLPILGEAGSSYISRIESVLATCRNVSATFKNALFPGVCFSCGRLFPIAPSEFDPHVDGADGQYRFAQLLPGHICTACRSQYAALESPMCSSCGLPFETSHGPDHICGNCMTDPPVYAQARAAGIYQGVLRSTIHQLKYERREKLARPLGRLLWETLRQYWVPDQFDWVIPVPLHSTRLRKRGFNQAQALVREWPQLAAGEGLRLKTDWIAAHLLVRYRPTEPQTGLKRDRRMENLRGAFRVNGEPLLQNRAVLIVDDVMTTGTTVDICAQTLLEAGAASVRVLTLARALL